MDDVKVSVTITLPGRVMLNNRECRKTVVEHYIDKRGHKRTKVKEIENYDCFDLSKVKLHDKSGSDIYNVYTRKCKPATQSINLNKDAYIYMTSNEIPEFSNIREWKNLSKRVKLETHLNKIAEYLGGVLKEYQVFED